MKYKKTNTLRWFLSVLLFSQSFISTTVRAVMVTPTEEQLSYEAASSIAETTPAKIDLTSERRPLDLSATSCGPYKRPSISNCIQKMEMESAPKVSVRQLSMEQNDSDISLRVGFNLNEDETKAVQALLLSSVTILVLSKPDQMAVEYASRNKSQLSRSVSQFGNEFAERYGKMAALGGLIYYVTKKPDDSFEMVQTTFLAAATVFGLKELGKLTTNIKLPIDSDNKPLQWANTSNTADLAFPSGHAAATATFLALIERYFDLAESKTYKYTAFTIYAATMWGRLHERKHFLSDVLASGVFYFLARGILNRGKAETTNQAYYINPSYRKLPNGDNYFGVDIMMQFGASKEDTVCIKKNGRKLSIEECIDKRLNPTQRVINL